MGTCYTGCAPPSLVSHPPTTIATAHAAHTYAQLAFTGSDVAELAVAGATSTEVTR